MTDKLTTADVKAHFSVTKLISQEFLRQIIMGQDFEVGCNIISEFLILGSLK